ncbi:restriction endonuclease subunit S [Aeromonas veronii]
MSAHWTTKTLGDCLEKVVDNRGKTPPLSAERTPYPMVEINAVVGSVKSPNLDVVKKFVTEETYNSWFRAGHPQYGDILFSTVGSIAEVVIVKSEICCIAQNLIGLRAKNALLDHDYLYYFLANPKTKSLLLSLDISSVQPSIKVPHLLAIEISYPNLGAQKRIAELLASLDDRIALLSETNATLEAIAQALFKSWFVDFDPVHARARGEQPAGLAPEVAALFPDSFEESALGLVPNGWCWRTMDDVSTVGIGKTPPRKEPQWFSENLDDVPWVSIKDMGTAGVFINNTSEFLTPASIDRFNVRVVPDNTVLLSFKLTVGRLSITDGEMVTNEAIAHFKLGEDSPLSSAYIYLALRQFNFESLSSTSSIAEAVNSKTVRAIPILVPSPSLVTMFNDYANPIFNRIKLLEKQAQTLANLRDTLLPRLISGQLRLPEAEAMVEGAS